MKNPCLRSLIVLGGLLLAAAPTAFASTAEDLFKRMDFNSDKKVTAAEHAQFAEMSFQQSDSDHDSKVNLAECEAAQMTYDKKAKIDKKGAAAHLSLVDTDADGQISQAENAAYAQNGFTRADKNGDGVLSEDEVEAAHKTMKKEMKQ